MTNLLLTRGTEWGGPDFAGLWIWRVLDLGTTPPYSILTARKIAEYPTELTAVEAARRAFAENPGCKLYMQSEHPDAPWPTGPQTVTQVMPFDA